MKYIRKFLGAILQVLHIVFPPRIQVRRSERDQIIVNKKLQGITLFQFAGCPFCIKVRRQSRRLNLSLPLADAAKDSQARQELLQEGGKIKVPCLKIKNEETGESQWMYESSVIMQYLEKNFST